MTFKLGRKKGIPELENQANMNIYFRGKLFRDRISDDW